MKMFLGLLQLRGREMAGRERNGREAERKREDRKEGRVEELEKEGAWVCRMVPQQVVSPTYLFL